MYLVYELHNKYIYRTDGQTNTAFQYTPIIVGLFPISPAQTLSHYLSPLGRLLPPLESGGVSNGPEYSGRQPIPEKL
jgi:hypothetical protein